MNRSTSEHASLVSRIGFGCGRLNAGADRKKSEALIQIALTSGIEYFDVAPSYGLGMAEIVLGDVFGGESRGVLIATKAGIARPRNPGALGVARSLLKPVANLIPSVRAAALKRLQNSTRKGQFEVADVERSLECSLKHLRQSHIHCLLMHEPNSSDLSQPLENFLNRASAAGMISTFGSGTGQPVEYWVPFGTVAQYRWSDSVASPHAQKCQVVVHGVLKEMLPRLAKLLEPESRATLELSSIMGMDCTVRDTHGAVAVALAASTFNGRILVSTNNPERLTNLLSKLTRYSAFDEIAPRLRTFHAEWLSDELPLVAHTVTS